MTAKFIVPHLLKALAASAMMLTVASSRAAAPGGAGHEYDGVKLTDEPVKSQGSVLPAEIVIDENRPVRDYSRRLFGLNYDWRELDALPMVKTVPGQACPQLNSDYLNTVRGIPLPFNRAGGGDSQKLRWKSAVGPVGERRVQETLWGKNGRILLTGPAEWIRCVQATEPDAEFVWTLNMVGDTPADAHDIAEFLTGGADTKWGKLRIESGLPRPVKPALWELGNELDWGSHGMSVEEYIKKCQAYMAAVRQVVPDAKFAALATTAPASARSQGRWPGWHRQLLAKLAPELSYLVFHPYYHGFKTAFVEKSQLDVLARDIKASANPDIKLYLSEHGKWPADKQHWYQTHALTGCLDTAEFMLRMLARPEVGAMTYHAQCAGPWGMVYTANYRKKLPPGKIYTTGIADLLRLFATVPAGATVVAEKMSGKFTDFTKTDLMTTAAAVMSKDGKTLYLIVCNRLPDTARELTFSARHRYRLQSRTMLTAPGLEAFNTAEKRAISLTTAPATGAETFQKAMVPPRSLTVYQLQKL